MFITAAHTFAVAGILLDMVALTVGFGPRTELNDLYHRTLPTRRNR
jgi:hypothetical protein